MHVIVSSPVSIFGKTHSLQVDNKTYYIYHEFKFTYASTLLHTMSITDLACSGPLIMLL